MPTYFSKKEYFGMKCALEHVSHKENPKNLHDIPTPLHLHFNVTLPPWFPNSNADAGRGLGQK